MKLEGVDQVKNNLNRFVDRSLKETANVLGKAITECENTAKRQAPWTDRTGNARNSITGSGPVTEANNVKTALSIGVFYGKYLELCRGGRYRIVWPTLEWIRPRVGEYMKGIMKL
jgi:hypothetical protein